MNKFKGKLTKFMAGRHGADQLYYAMIAVCFILIIANLFIKTYILDILMFALLILTTFRAFSRNQAKRYKENAAFLKLLKPVKEKASLAYHRIKERKTHVYRKCPCCKKVIRLPKKKGTHTAGCPCCHNKFEVRVRF